MKRTTAVRHRRRSTSRALRRSGVLAAAMLTGVAVGAEPAAAAPPGKNLGPLIDGYQPYVGQSSCNSTEQPGVVSFRSMVLAAYPGTGDSGILRGCSVGGQSEHKEGRAWDWRVSAFTQHATADDLLNWLLATDKYGNRHALLRRFGIMYIIWDRQIFRAYNPDAGWQPYSCSGVTDCHQDHVHFSFGWPGALQQTSWWAGGSFGKQTVGFYQPSNGTWHLRNTHSSGPSDLAFAFGATGARPITGDWNADGKTTIGYYQPSNATFNLRNTNNAGPADHSFAFGPPGMVPLAGDWNNDGKTTVGFYRPSDGSFHLRDTLNAGPSDHSFRFGPPGMIPVTGDWNNDGKTTVGYYNPTDGTWHLNDQNDSSAAEANFRFGPPGMRPVTGDWNADGKTTIGYYRPSDGTYVLRNALSDGPADHVFNFGPASMAPVAGDWDKA